MKLYAIANWSKLYENNRSRVVTDLRWVPIPNKLDGEHFSAIMNHPDGAVIFTGFVLLVEIASRCSPRGTLARSNGQPHTPTTLAQKCRCPVNWFETALKYLETHTDWLHVTDTSAPRQRQVDDVVEVSRPSAQTDSYESQPSRLTVSDFDAIRKRISAVYGPTRRWSNYEEQMLVEVSRNSNAMAELDTILNYRAALAPADRAFFPQSVTKLLEKWDELLDRSRVLPPRPGSPDKEIARLRTQADKL